MRPEGLHLLRPPAVISERTMHKEKRYTSPMLTNAISYPFTCKVAMTLPQDCRRGLEVYTYSVTPRSLQRAGNRQHAPRPPRCYRWLTRDSSVQRSLSG